MPPSESNNRRIIKNTLLLYFRMIFLTIINIFTVRIVLEALGVENYGIYSVVSTAVFMLGFLQGTLSSATQRYFSFQLAQQDVKEFSRLYSLIMICFIIVGGVVLLVGGFSGPFIVEDFLNIPEGRKEAAVWVFYSSLGSFTIGLLTVPYTASMISYERMNGFAYLSILDGILKLGIAYAVMYSSFDHLVFYAILSFIQSLIIFIFYAIYCRRCFEGVRFNWHWEKKLIKELLNYTGWNLFGSVSGVLSTSGQGIILNLFFGPIVNAAKGIADRIYSVVQSFATNFYLAVSPQIVKSYANKDLSRMFALVISSTKFSYFLLLIISYPLIICMPALLIIWLGENKVSPEMIIFSQLALVLTLVNSLEQPITQMIRATGKIRNYQFFVGIFTIFYLPVATLVLWLGASAQSTMVVLILLMLFVQIIRIIVARKQMKMPVKDYLEKAILPIIYVSGLLAAIGFFLNFWHTHTLLLHIAKGSSALFISIVIISQLGMSSDERMKTISTLKKKLFRRS